MNWNKASETILREMYERGFSDQSIADAITMKTGQECTRHHVRHYAEKLALTKDPESGGNVPLFQRPRKYVHTVLDRLKEGARVLIAFNDMQIPFQDDPSINALLKFASDFEPHVTVAIGDGFDFYGLSDFDKNASRTFRMQDELDVGRRIMRRIETAVKDADLYWIDGNHEDRLRRFLWRNGEAVASLRSLDPIELMSLEDWSYHPYGSSISVMGVVMEHGEGATGNMARTMLAKRGTSGICGHSHRLQDVHVTNASGAHRYIENACLCSLEPEFVSRPNWQHGFTYGFVREGQLRLFPTLIEFDGFRAEGHWYKRAE